MVEIQIGGIRSTANQLRQASDGRSEGELGFGDTRRIRNEVKTSFSRITEAVDGLASTTDEPSASWTANLAILRGGQSHNSY
jgi:hypothetical protein